MPQVVFPDCTAYMAQFFDKAALAVVSRARAAHRQGLAGRAARGGSGGNGDRPFSDALTGPILAACPHLRIIVFLGTGVSSWVDLPAAQQHGIVVRRVLGYAGELLREERIAAARCLR